MIFYLIFLSILAGLVGFLSYIYHAKKGYFDDEESIKYQIFREDNPDN